LSTRSELDRSLPQASIEIASAYLLDFFSTGGRSVLVRGDPGTGKTSFVLQLLDYHSKNNFRSVYMSTRLSAKTLKSHQPWVEMVQGKYGTVPRLGEDQIGFQDSRRMDGVRAISGLRAYLEQVSNPFVVLDSWEGLFFESHNLGVEEISKLVEDYDARFVVVTERREQTDLDYLLDGVIVLRRKFHESRVVREVELKKLRGVSIRQSRFIFTLDQGKFRYLAPYSFGYVAPNSPVGEPIASTYQGLFSSGSTALDNMIGGGFRQASFDLVELSNQLPFEVTSLFLRTIISNFVNCGHKILYVPFLGSPKSQLESILPNFSTETLEDRIVFVGYDQEGKPEAHRQVLSNEASDAFGKINSKIEDMGKAEDKPPLIVFSEDAIEGIYGADEVSKYLARSISISKNYGAITLHLATPSSKLLHELKSLCDCNISLEMIHGTPVIYSIKPFSELYGLIGDKTAPGRLDLVPIV
jgi:KaiC/GvpD/RAD55 family RecA-like ATPase